MSDNGVTDLPRRSIGCLLGFHDWQRRYPSLRLRCTKCLRPIVLR